MTTAQLDALVRRGVARALEGDDEALNALVLELRPLVVGAIPDYLRTARQPAPVEVCVQEALLALYEALILWRPEQGSFAEKLDWRIRMRLGALFLRLKDLHLAVGEGLRS